jgi:hypothetical protein
LAIGSLEGTFSRKIDKDADSSQQDPEEKILIAPNECEHHSEQRAYLTKCTAEHQSRLNTCLIVIYDRPSHVLAA